MSKTILTLMIQFEQDLVTARQRARQIAELLGFKLNKPLDFTSFSELLKRIQQGYIQAHAGPEDSQLPIIVLLDLRLPKVDGIEVLRHARQHPVWKQVPIIVMTTSRENTDIEAAYEMGVNSYLVKPVDFAAFAGLVKTIQVYWLLTNQPPFPAGAAR